MKVVVRGKMGMHRGIAFLPFSMLLLGLSLAGCGASPKDVFERAVLRPMPDSVKVLNSKEKVGFDTSVWLHFTIEPADLQRIIDAGPYEAEPRSTVQTDPKAPKWWTPSALGDGMRVYQWNFDKTKNNYWSKTLYANSASNEVYIFAFEIWR